jgi:glucokinase
MFIAVDLGATKTLFALAERAGTTVRLHRERRYEDDAFATFEAMAARYLEEAGAAAVQGVCIGAAGPVAAGRVRLTNRDWTLDAGALAARFGWTRVAIVNDFAAAASGVSALGADDVETLQAGRPEADAARVVLGAGSGLGVAYALPEPNGWRVVAGEGGHAGFAPETARQARLAEHWRARAGRVSAEFLVSGPGIERIYAHERSLCTAPASALDAALDAALARGEGAAAITAAAARGDPLAEAALDLFAECYGQVAGDHALAVMAAGGVYVAGGIAPKVLPHLRGGGFLRGFRAKGPQAALMERFPVHVVTHPALGLLGAGLIATRLA